MDRIKSIDTGRFIAILAIITLHTQPFRLVTSEQNSFYLWADFFITNLVRFAVPFFFVISGYFWGRKIRTGEAPIPFSAKKIGKILLIFIGWSFVYLIPFQLLRTDLALWSLVDLLRDYVPELLNQPLIDLFMRGTKLHLWFLVALIFSVAISAVFVNWKKEKSLLFLSAALYVVGVLSKGYEDTPIGIGIGFNTLYGPFFGTLFFVSGYFLSGFKNKTNWFWKGTGLFIFGCALHFTEIIILWKVFDNLPQHDYVFGTYFMGVGFAVMVLADIPWFRNHLLAGFGRLSLGIYAVHYIFVDLFFDFDQTHFSFIWEVGYVLIVFGLSALIAYGLSRIKLIRIFVL